jgi:bacteriorhodopsin
MRALWVFFAFFTLAVVVTLIMAKRVERKLRLFHLVTGIILVTAHASYLVMACGMGVTWVRSFKHAADGAPVIRQVFYARYIDWAITTPLLLLDLALLAGMPTIQIVTILFADLVMVLMGLFAGLQDSSERSRWFLYAISCAFYLYVLFGIVGAGRKAASLQSSSVKRIYNVTSGMIIVLWTGYPIIFALTEGKGRISVDAEVICYGILDVLAKIVFGFYLLSAHSHSEGDSVVLPESWTEPRGSLRYGAIASDD